jgi:hypothetical protein
VLSAVPKVDHPSDFPSFNLFLTGSVGTQHVKLQLNPATGSVLAPNNAAAPVQQIIRLANMAQGEVRNKTTNRIGVDFVNERRSDWQFGSRSSTTDHLAKSKM